MLTRTNFWFSFAAQTNRYEKSIDMSNCPWGVVSNKDNGIQSGFIEKSD